MGWSPAESVEFPHGDENLSISITPFLQSHELKQSSEWIYRPEAYGLVTIAWIGSVSIKINGFYS